MMTYALLLLSISSLISSYSLLITNNHIPRVRLPIQLNHKGTLTSLHDTSTTVGATEFNLNANSFKLPHFDISPKLRRRWATGLSLGAIGTLWIASGNGLFT